MMIDFLAYNWGTLFIGALVLAVVGLIIVKLYREKKKGHASCGCGCDHCPSSGVCHKK